MMSGEMKQEGEGDITSDPTQLLGLQCMQSSDEPLEAKAASTAKGVLAPSSVNTCLYCELPGMVLLGAPPIPPHLQSLG